MIQHLQSQKVNISRYISYQVSPKQTILWITPAVLLVIFFILVIGIGLVVSVVLSALLTTCCHVVVFFNLYWVPGVSVQAKPKHENHPEYEDGEGVLVRSKRPKAAVTVHNPPDEFEIELDYEPVFSIEPTDRGNNFKYSKNCLEIDGADVTNLHLNLDIELDGDYRGEAKKELKFRHQQSGKILNRVYLLL